MKTFFLTAFILIALMPMTIKAQACDCSRLCITDLELDSLVPGLLHFAVFFEDSDQTFINYPYIRYVFDENDDTIGTGTLNFFGQFGNTTTVYTAETELTSLPANFHCTADFVFNFDTCGCLLEFPCTTSAIDHVKQIVEEGKIYPNPTNGTALLETGFEMLDAELTLIDLSGKEIYTQQHLSGQSATLFLNHLPRGMYQAMIRNDGKVIPVGRVVVVE